MIFIAIISTEKNTENTNKNIEKLQEQISQLQNELIKSNETQLKITQLLFDKTKEP